MNILGIDVGGSGIKGALVDLDSGELFTKRKRIPTPQTFTMQDVADTIAKIVKHFDYSGPLGVGFPSVVSNGVVGTPPTAHHYPGWVGNSIKALIEKGTHCSATVLNDADAAGVAEMKFGVGQGEDGVVLLLTLGTGVGSGLFNNGRLVPNTELGKIYLQGHSDVAELYMAGRIKEEQELSYENWGKRLNEYLQHVEWLFSPRLCLIGGGISKTFDEYADYLDVKMRVLPATLRNHAGIIGAAAAAVDAEII